MKSASRNRQGARGQNSRIGASNSKRQGGRRTAASASATRSRKAAAPRARSTKAGQRAQAATKRGGSARRASVQPRTRGKAAKRGR